MDIQTNLGSRNPYSSGPTGSLPAPASYASNFSDRSTGKDSLTAFFNETGSNYAEQEQSLKFVDSLKVIKVVCMTLALISVAVFLILFLQPFLAIIFTMGGCLDESCDEWADFAFEIMTAGVFPASAALMLFGIYFLTSLRLKSLQSKLAV